MYNLIIDLEMCNVPRDYRQRSYKYANETIQIGAVLLDENFKGSVHSVNMYTRNMELSIILLNH